MHPIASSHLLNKDVYTREHALAGTIEELILDPGTGVVRFAHLRTSRESIILVPWAALAYSESGQYFRLTEMGELIYSRL